MEPEPGLVHPDLCEITAHHSAISARERQILARSVLKQKVVVSDSLIHSRHGLPLHKRSIWRKICWLTLGILYHSADTLW